MNMTVQQLEEILRRAEAATPGDLTVSERDTVWVNEHQWLGEFFSPTDAELFAHARRDIAALTQYIVWLRSVLKTIHRDWEAGILPPTPRIGQPYALMTIVEHLLTEPGAAQISHPMENGGTVKEL